MIELKNVSKFYYSKGVIASGFSKVNLKLKIGEFVAITGESGSGKSTLLNVISGLDTYEEGELYINGEETSHYTEKDFENYRRKYIGNIFQNFNLINSYTVYQNIELVLLLNGESKKNIKPRVLELIKKVDLYKFRNTKVSKLSGGQKQRVAIARAIAKETPIIIADEPTGNLDSKSAESVMKILSEISKDKLVIIVTHNYEQVEKYATRKITMNDGRIIEDKVIKKVEKIPDFKISEIRDIKFINKLKLGIRNTFNIIPKFLLVLAVYLFITMSLLSEYSSFKKEEHDAELLGYNSRFINHSENRVIIKKLDKTPFSEEDYEKIKNLPNIERIVENDILLDLLIQLSSENQEIWLSGSVKDKNKIDSVDIGKLPENDFEIVLYGSKNDYYFNQMQEQILNQNLYLFDDFGKIKKDKVFKIVGLKYSDNDSILNMEMYMSKNTIDEIGKIKMQMYNTTRVLFENKYYYDDYWLSNIINNNIVANNNVPQGKVYVSSNVSTNILEGKNSVGKTLDIEVKNINYEDKITLTIDKTYTKKNMGNLLGEKDYDRYNGSIFINPQDFNNLYNKESYQSSVFVKEIKEIDETVQSLNDLGLKTLKVTDTLVKEEGIKLLKMIRTFATFILVAGLFFITYFVLNIILKSRNIYFTTIRMLGASKKVSTHLLIIELLTATNIAYFVIIALIQLVNRNIIKFNYLLNLSKYLTIYEYTILYFILITISYLVSMKYAKKLFKKSSISAYNEEV